DADADQQVGGLAEAAAATGQKAAKAVLALLDEILEVRRPRAAAGAAATAPGTAAAAAGAAATAAAPRAAAATFVFPRHYDFPCCQLPVAAPRPSRLKSLRAGLISRLSYCSSRVCLLPPAGISAV